MISKKAAGVLVLTFSCVVTALAQTQAGCATPNGILKVPVVPGPPTMANVARTDFPGPVISVRPDFYTLSVIARQLVLSHECGHAALQTNDEAAAARYSGQLMCKMSYSLTDLKSAQAELISKNLTSDPFPAIEVSG